MAGPPLPVVVVDDAVEVRAVVKLQLRLSDRFVVVGEGGSGREAIDLVVRHRPAILLLDASMPDVDGVEALPAILTASPTTRVVMLSGFDTAGLRARALELGAADYIEKARPLTELPARLLALVDDRPFESTDVAGPSAPNDEANAVLAAHLERFSTVFEQAAIGMATLTLTGTIVRVNRAFTTLIGSDEADLVGRNYADLAPGADRDALRGAIARAARRTAGGEDLEHRLATASGGALAHTLVAPVQDEAGSALYLFAQTEDVTLRHAALQDLRASEDRFRLMVESVRDYAIFMLDAGGRVATWNLGAERMKGYAADEIMGQHFRAFYPTAAQTARHPEYELEVAEREGRYEEEGWRVRKDGTQFWANVVITALFDQERNLVGFAKVTRDMTERRRAQEERDRAALDLALSNEDLKAATQRTEEYLAVTAHELQSPVTAITGSAQILSQYWDKLDPAERAEALQRIVAGGTRIRGLLEDLLTASRLDAGSFAVMTEPVNLGTVVDQALREVPTLRPGDVEVSSMDDVTVCADPIRVVQIITNLLTNAGKYGKPPVTIDATQQGSIVEIRVRDGGAGVASEMTPHLFDKFARGQSPGKRGSGLGLFIVRELARAHGGDAWYESGGDTGPCFAVALPAAQ